MYASTSCRTSGPIRLAVVIVAAATAAVLGVQADQASAAAGVGRAGAAGIVSTIAGGPGGPGPARRVAITVCGKFISQGGCGFSFAAGNLYVTDLGWPNSSGDVVRQVNMRTGRLTTPAGDGQPGFGGNGGPATQAQISELNDASVDAAGNLLVTDGISVRVVPPASGTFYGQGMTAHHIYAVAGGGTSTQDGVPATAASIRPRGATVDHSRNLVICGSSALRVVAATTGTFYGRAMTAGDIYTVAGGGGSGQDGVPATTAAITPYAVAVDAAGNLLLADPRAGRLRVVAASTGRFYGQAMTSGDIYTIAGGGRSHRDGVRATREWITPFGLAIDRSGNLVEADFGFAKVRVVATRNGRFYGRAMTAGDIYTVAGGGTSKGNGVLATAAMLRHPHAVAVDGAGNIAIGDQLSNYVRVVAARTGTFYGVPMRAGHLYFVAGNGRTWSSGADARATRAQFFPVLPITFDDGNLVAPETHATRSSLNTSIRLVPARSGSFFGIAMKAGHLYRIAGNGGETFAGNGTPALKSGIGQIFGVAADSRGNLVLADTDNYRILVVAARNGRFYGRAMRTGRIYSIAGNGKFGFSGDGGPAVKAEIEPGFPRIDQNGNVIFGQNPRIRVVADRTGTFYNVPMTAGDIYTVAGGTQGTGGDGGPALDAQFMLINGVVRDGTDGVLVSDRYRIRMIATANGTFFGVPMTAGDIYTVAGTGNQGSAADGTPARAADISPMALAVDAARNLIFYDEGVNKVRVVAATTATYYGVPMTAGHIYTIVGGGTGSLGDGGPGNQATINFVTGLAVNAQGLAFTDGQDNRVRMIWR
jgi:hypothetical protein